MRRNLETWQPGQVFGTRVERTNVGHNIHIDVQGKTIELQFRDEDVFGYIEQLARQAAQVREDSPS